MALDLIGGLNHGLTGRYEVGYQVGHGGMAAVFQATRLTDGDQVAIKVLWPELARAVAARRFLREVDILASLSHANLLPFLEAGTVEVVNGLKLPWLATPLLPESLADRLKREPRLAIPVAVGIARDLCAGLGAAHVRGVLHRDIKPSNVLLEGDRAVLGDFGLARAIVLAGGDRISTTGILVGSPTYMSPEQSRGEELDERSDVYSLGVVLYEMLAGEALFTGATFQAIAARHQVEEAPSIRMIRPEVDHSIEAWLHAALSKTPSTRPIHIPP